MKPTKEVLKKIKALRSKKGRKEQQRFAVGGVRLLEEALRHGFLPSLVLFSLTKLNERGEMLVSLFQKRNIPNSKVSSKDIDLVSDTTTSQGILAVFETPEAALTKLYKPNHRRLLLCDEISDPGNLGTLARSALAFEFDMMLVSGKSMEIFSPKVVRSSAGALFKLPVAKVSYEELDEFKKRRKAVVVATRASRKSAEVKLLSDSKFPVILAIGSEATGLSEGVQKLSDRTISISHSRSTDSLNAAVAGSIIMKQIYDSSRSS